MCNSFRSAPYWHKASIEQLSVNFVFSCPLLVQLVASANYIKTVWPSFKNLNVNDFKSVSYFLVHKLVIVVCVDCSCCCMRETGWTAGRRPFCMREREPSPTSNGGPISSPGLTAWYDHTPWTTGKNPHTCIIIVIRRLYVIIVGCNYTAIVKYLKYSSGIIALFTLGCYT